MMMDDDALHQALLNLSDKLLSFVPRRTRCRVVGRTLTSSQILRWGHEPVGIIVVTVWL